jgi:hypothetical protein
VKNRTYTPDELAASMEGITASTTYAEFVEKMFAQCWFLTGRCMAAIQTELRGPFKQKVNQAFEAMVSAIESKVPHDRVVDLIDAIAHARTDFQLAIENICRWFQRATAQHRDTDVRDCKQSVDHPTPELASCEKKCDIRKSDWTSCITPCAPSSCRRLWTCNDLGFLPF